MRPNASGLPLPRVCIMLQQQAGSSMSILLKSYAKVNLALDILGLRHDGYHDIRTVFYEIDLADELQMSLRADPDITLEVIEGEAPSGSGNLAVRAARMARDASGTTQGIHIRLAKRIPMQAGLGGGSSNAASALKGAAELCGYTGDLDQIAAELGSDVPFFLHGGAALGEGRGEVLHALPATVSLDLLIAKPHVGVSTARAYEEVDRSGAAGKGGYAARVKSAMLMGDRDAVVRAMGNDFDPVVCKSERDVAAIKALLLESGAEKAMLCGSGSAVMGVFRSREEAVRAAAAFADVWCAAATGVCRCTPPRGRNA